MQRSVIEAKAVSVRVDGDYILKDGWFSINEGELIGFCHTSQFRSFFPLIINAGNVDYTGRLLFLGKSVNHRNPIRAMYISGAQMLIDSMSVAENLAVIRREKTVKFFYNPNKTKRVLSYVLRDHSVPFELSTPVSRLSASQKFMLLLIKGMLLDVPVIVLDNVTQQCSNSEYDWISSFISHCCKTGKTFVLLSNNNDFFIEKADRVYFCRGRHITDVLFHNEITASKFEQIFYTSQFRHTDVMRSRADYSRPILSFNPLEEKPSVTVHRGELVGLLDLRGTQIPQIFKSVQDSFPRALDGKMCRSLHEACASGLALISLHRGSMYFDGMSFSDNLLLLKMKLTSKFLIRNKRVERYYLEKFGLSFNEQIERNEWNWNYLKLLLYRWMLVSPKIVVIEDPPLDLEREQQIEFLEILQRIIDSGGAVVLISSAKNECTKICDRVYEI